MSTTPTPVKSVPVAASPQVVSVPVGIPQQLQQQILQQQGAAAQLVSATGQNLAYNVMQPMQTVTVDGQEALFIPAMSLAGAENYFFRGIANFGGSIPNENIFMKKGEKLII